MYVPFIVPKASSDDLISPRDAKYAQDQPSSKAHCLFYPADYAITHNLTPFISMQNQYSLVYREEEREMMPTLKVSWFDIVF